MYTFSYLITLTDALQLTEYTQHLAGDIFTNVIGLYNYFAQQYKMSHKICATFILWLPLQPCIKFYVAPPTMWSGNFSCLFSCFDLLSFDSRCNEGYMFYQTIKSMLNNLQTVEWKTVCIFSDSFQAPFNAWITILSITSLHVS